MSIELAVNMTGEKEEFEHRMDHDIESLLHVFLHIVRFTPGPQGDPSTDIKVTINEIRISQWHHECLVANIPQLKSLDILRAAQHPANGIGLTCILASSCTKHHSTYRHRLSSSHHSYVHRKKHCHVVQTGAHGSSGQMPQTGGDPAPIWDIYAIPDTFSAQETQGCCR